MPIILRSPCLAAKINNVTRRAFFDARKNLAKNYIAETNFREFTTMRVSLENVEKKCFAREILLKY